MFSPWGDKGLKAQGMETISTLKPFLLKERLAEQLQAAESAAESEDLQDNPEVVDDEPTMPSPDSFMGDASPMGYVLSLIPEPISSLQPVPASTSDSPIGPIRHSNDKTGKNARKDCKNRLKRSLARANQQRQQGDLSEQAIHRCQGSEPLSTDGFSLQEDAEVGSGGYTGKRMNFERVHSSVAELEAQGLREVKWDPRRVIPGTDFLFH